VTQGPLTRALAASPAAISIRERTVPPMQIPRGLHSDGTMRWEFMTRVDVIETRAGGEASGPLSKPDRGTYSVPI